MDLTNADTLMSIASTVVPLLLMVAVFYFLLIRPQSKREKKTKQMLAAVKVGDRVTTIGGIFGRVSSIKGDVLTVEVGSDKTKLSVARWGIRSVEGETNENEMSQLGQ